jgi:hypothetical protein
LAVVAFAALAGFGGSDPAGPERAASAAPVTSPPQLSPFEARYVDMAWRATVAHDPACNGLHGPEVTAGTPSRALTSTFAILRSLVATADRLRRLLRVNGPPGGPAWTAGVQLYLNQIHRARSAFGATFYVLPAGNVSGQRGVPARCGPEQITALRRQASHLPARQRALLLAAQSRYLAYARYLAVHPEGICATFIVRRALGDNFGCATLADFQRWGVLADTQAYLGGSVAVWWTVVPDRVATVILSFGGPSFGGPHAATLTVHPVDNVVVAREPLDAPRQSGFPSSITLLAADGSVIKKIAVTPNMPTLCGYGC